MSCVEGNMNDEEQVRRAEKEDAALLADFYRRDNQGHIRVGYNGVTVHTFESSGLAYDSSQCWDTIKDGDVLWVPKEGSAAVLLQAWPVAVNKGYTTDLPIYGVCNCDLPPLPDNVPAANHEDWCCTLVPLYYQRFHGVMPPFSFEEQELYRPKYDKAIAVARALIGEKP